MRRLLLIPTLAVLACTAQAHDDPPAARAPAVQSVAADWQPLAAQYRVTLRTGHGPVRNETWTLHRDARRIALIKAEQEEVWLREPSGIRLQRLFHVDHKLVDYSAGELRTLGIDAHWAALGTLFDETLLTQLKKTGTRHYAGRLGSETIALEWDADQRLPLRLSRRSEHGSVLMERLAVVTADAPMRWPHPSPDRSDYDRLDAADFGDMEGDPFVRKVLAQEVRIGWRTEHGH